MWWVIIFPWSTHGFAALCCTTPMSLPSYDWLYFFFSSLSASCQKLAPGCHVDISKLTHSTLDSWLSFLPLFILCLFPSSMVSFANDSYYHLSNHPLQSFYSSLLIFFHLFTSFMLAKNSCSLLRTPFLLLCSSLNNSPTLLELLAWVPDSFCSHCLLF